MEFLEVLFNHPRFKKLFTVEPDMNEIFMALASTALGLEILLRLGSAPNNVFNNIAIKYPIIGWVFLVQGIFSYFVWYDESWIWRRFMSMSGFIVWLALTLLLSLNASLHITDIVQWSFLIGAAVYAWIYLRLGMSEPHNE